ncbi:chloride channel protein [Beijerinckia sp. L45]|uniref:chloride channel protein n=1 Tax=Beijerinckia sp. L45 TaxID=1641855 RepID=UPI001FEED1A8|nr:chloride channel protein [Beijerinckia sp. L45]
MRQSRLAQNQWTRRVIFLAGGFCVGGAAVLMALMADKAQALFRDLLAISPYLALVVTPAGFGVAVYLARTVFPNSQGSGIPQVIAARQIDDPEARLALVSLRVAFGKVVVMMLGLLCGASIGREGPTVQVGASIMGAIGRRSTVVYQQGLLLAGAAAGIAAAFNTPLAGIVFGIEELSRSFESKTSGLILGCIIAAGITSLGILGDYTYFGSTAEILPLGRAWLVVPLCAVLGGLFGGLFSKILIIVLTGGREHAYRRFIKGRPIVFAMLCGLGVACCGMLGHHSSYGTGYEEARGILHGTSDLTLAFAPAKFVATILSAISGIPGGIFAPSLAIGAGLGAELHAIFQSVPLGALALIGMASYLAGVVQTPITSFVIVSEMTQDHAMVIPLMVAALIADGVSKLVCKEGLYHALSKSFLPKEPASRLEAPLPPPRAA